jgi:hypothetical protein
MNNFCVPNPADLPFIVEQRLDAKSPMALNIECRELPQSGSFGARRKRRAMSRHKHW